MKTVGALQEVRRELGGSKGSFGHSISTDYIVRVADFERLPATANKQEIPR